MVEVRPDFVLGAVHESAQNEILGRGLFTLELQELVEEF